LNKQDKSANKRATRVCPPSQQDWIVKCAKESIRRSVLRGILILWFFKLGQMC